MKTTADFYKENINGMCEMSKAAQRLHFAAIDLSKLDEELSSLIQSEDSDNENINELSKAINQTIALTLKISGELIHKKLATESLIK